MPSRRSDRGRALAKGIREYPQLAQDMAELSEPYGTITAIKDLEEDPTNPMNYLYAMPVIGGAARFARKGSKAAEAMRKASIFDKDMPKNTKFKDLDPESQEYVRQKMQEQAAQYQEKFNPPTKPMRQVTTDPALIEKAHSYLNKGTARQAAEAAQAMSPANKEAFLSLLDELDPAYADNVMEVLPDLDL